MSWTVGVLKQAPEELAAKFGLEFLREEADGLGSYMLAVLDAGFSGQLWLVSYDHSPQPGTEVWADIATTRDEAMNALWLSANWDIRAFSWVNPYPAFPRSQSLGETLGIGALKLTPREAEVGRLLADGATTDTIAATLRVSASAVRRHLGLLRLKFGVASTEELKRRLAAMRMEPPASSIRHSA